MSSKVNFKLKARRPRRPKRGKQLTAGASVKLSVGAAGTGKKVIKNSPPAGSRGKPGNKKSGGGSAKAKSADSGNKKERRGGQPGLLQRISPRTVIFIILMGVFIAFSIGPITRNMEATSRLKAKEQELAAEKKTTEDLKKEAKEARSLEHIEEEARGQHMVAPGETVYVITSDTNSKDADIKIKNLQNMDEAWGRVQQLLNCRYERPEK